MKRLNLILNGKGGVGKSYADLLYILNQPTKTAVGRLTLCKPFLATAAVWLDSVARCCGSHLRFCFRKICPAAGTKPLAIDVVNSQAIPVGTIECQVVRRHCVVDNDAHRIRIAGGMNQLQPEPIKLRTGIIASSRLRQFCQLSPGKVVPALSMPAAQRQAWVGQDCLKMNYGWMKMTELTKLLWKAVNESDELPLSEPEQQLYTKLHLAVMAYDDEVRLGHPAIERRCMICNVPLSQCCC